MSKSGISSFTGGLNTDVEPVHMPDGDYIYALNAKLDGETNIKGLISNEQGNEIAGAIPDGWVVCGHTYMRDGDIVLFLSKPDNDPNNTDSQIGIFNINTGYKTHVRFPKLNFSAERPIECTFRVRRGCERTIYWVEKGEKGNAPRYFIFENPSVFKFKNGKWNVRAFLLQKNYERPPSFKVLSVHSGGSLEPGSYFVSVQYVDANDNKTEWICTSKKLVVYNSNPNDAWINIAGSINSSSQPFDFGKTDKCIEVQLGDIDLSYPYYRLAFICYNSGNGNLSNIWATDNIPVENNKFVYNGFNATISIPSADFARTNVIYTEAKSIEQIENRLVLGNVADLDINWCRLQYYASKIAADCVTQTYLLDDASDPFNPKNPINDNGFVGYMPGEVYSFGIVYVFEGGIKSPVYHIPGKSGDVAHNKVYSWQPGAYGMWAGDSTYNNKSDGKYYNTKPGFDYWGLDCEGKRLDNQPVRHHRFPDRYQLNKPHVDIRQDNSGYYKTRCKIVITGLIPANQTSEDIDDLSLSISYKQDGIAQKVFVDIAQPLNDGDSDKPITYTRYGQYFVNSSDITDIVVSYSHGSGEYKLSKAKPQSGGTTLLNLESYNYIKELAITISQDSKYENNKYKNIRCTALGIKFSNIFIPSLDDTNGHKCIGYYIVRNERTFEDRTIIDNVAVMPGYRMDQFVAVGLAAPVSLYSNDGDGDPRVNNSFDGGARFARLWDGTIGGRAHAADASANIYNFLSPSYLFEDIKFGKFSHLISVGKFTSINQKYGYLLYDDIMDGTSWNKKDDVNRNDDGDQKNKWEADGWSLAIIGRDTNVRYDLTYATQRIQDASCIANMYYLNALDSVDVKASGYEVFNLSTNNKALVALMKWNEWRYWLNSNNTSGNVYFDGKSQIVPGYVCLYKKNNSPYSTFDNLPYFAETSNVIDFPARDDNSEDVPVSSVVYGGDAYIHAIRYVSIIFQMNQEAIRVKRSGVGKIIGGIGAILGGIGLAVSTLGIGAIGGGVALAGAGVMMLSSGIKQEKANSIINDKYGSGLFKLALDDIFYKWVVRNYGADGIIPCSDNPLNLGRFGTDDGAGNPSERDRVVARWNAPAFLGVHGYSDDTIMWEYDAVSDLIFESNENYALRHGFANSGITPYLPSISSDGSPNRDPYDWWGIHIKDGGDRTSGLGDNIFYIASGQQRRPRNSLEQYVEGQLLVKDPSRTKSGYKFKGIPFGVYYGYNKDYKARCRLKPFFTIPKDYNCTSACQNKYPNRIVWSQQSFQESRSDNFTQLLPNNYYDIPGTSGNITKLIRYNSKLYTLTTEALWEHPDTRQERENAGVVTFIGTGDFLSVPPRMVLDTNNGIGGGCLHSMGVIKTPYGFAYVSYSERKVYLYNGQLQPLSDAGMGIWFKDNITINCDENYFKLNKEPFRFRDNTYLNIGSGFTLGFDNYTNRLLVSKKDIYGYGDEQGGFVVSTNGNDKYIFRDYKNVIAGMVHAGWEYLGINGIYMNYRKFVEREVIETNKVTKTRKVPKVIKVDKDIFANATIFTFRFKTFDDSETGDLDVFFKITAPKNIMANYLGYGSGASSAISDNGMYWYAGDWRSHDKDGAEMFAVSIDAIKKKYPDAQFIEIEAWCYWCTEPTKSDRAYILIESYDGGSPRLNDVAGKNFIFIDGGEKLATVKSPKVAPSVVKKIGGGTSTNLQATYTTLLGKFRYYLSTGKFTDISNTALGEVVVGSDGGGTTTIKVDKTIMVDEEYQEDVLTKSKKLVPTFTNIKAVPFNPQVINNSWTLSYSFNNNRWISYHSYLPSGYIFSSDNLLSFVNNNNHIYKHNSKLYYNTYYGYSYPHVVEFVCKSEDLRVKLFDSFSFSTDAIVNGYDSRYITFNKAVVYNGRQCSGLLELKPRENTDRSWMDDVAGDNEFGVCMLDRREKNWTMNEFYDISRLYNAKMWDADIAARQQEYYTDKVLNTTRLASDMDWRELERFRDRYIIVRLIFDARSDTQLLTRFFSSNLIDL